MATEDPAVLKAIRLIFKSENPKDFWHDYSDKQEKEIEDAAKQLANGDSDSLTNQDF